MKQALSLLDQAQQQLGDQVDLRLDRAGLWHLRKGHRFRKVLIDLSQNVEKFSTADRCDLRLMPSVEAVSNIPREGKNLIVVADVNKTLHIRVFDPDGKMVVDTDQEGLTDKAQEVEGLRRHLESLWPPCNITGNEKDRLVAAIPSIIGHSMADRKQLLNGLAVELVRQQDLEGASGCGHDWQKKMRPTSYCGSNCWILPFKMPTRMRSKRTSSRSKRTSSRSRRSKGMKGCWVATVKYDT